MRDDNIEVVYPGKASDEISSQIAELLKEYDDVPNHSLIQRVNIEADGLVEVEYFHEDPDVICKFNE